MKASALITLLLSAFTAFAGDIPNLGILKCRNYDTNSELLRLPAARLVAHDLSHGLWTTEKAPGKKQLFQFNEFGLADILTIGEKGLATYSSALWRVEEFDGRAFLVLTFSEKNGEHLLRVEQTCQGISLKNVLTQEEWFLDYHPLVSHVKVNLVKADLIGEWTNVSYPFDVVKDLEKCGTFEEMKGAFLQVRFQKDGSYSLSYGSNMMRVEETGVWEVSKDGQFLLLHVAENGNPEKISKTKVAKIRQVDEHGLILEQAMATEDFSDFFCTEFKPFAFIK